METLPPITGLLQEESTGDRWIPFTQDHWCGASMSTLYLTQTTNSLMTSLTSRNYDVHVTSLKRDYKKYTQAVISKQNVDEYNS